MVEESNRMRLTPPQSLDWFTKVKTKNDSLFYVFQARTQMKIHGLEGKSKYICETLQEYLQYFIVELEEEDYAQYNLKKPTFLRVMVNPRFNPIQKGETLIYE